MNFKTKYVFSDDYIKLLQKRYECYVLLLMNKSKVVFPNTYSAITNQSHGECDFIDTITNEKYDAKLPFTDKQVKLLVSGKKHSPLFKEWFDELYKEIAEFNLMSDFNVRETTLYKIIYKMIIRDNSDENIIFFFPYGVILDSKDSVFIQFARDLFTDIYDGLKDFIGSRKVYVIYPSSEKNYFVVRNIENYYREYIECEQIGNYFTHELAVFI